MFTKFPGLAISGRHNSAVITDRQKFTTKLTLYGMSGFKFLPLEEFKSFPPAMYAPYRKRTYTNFRQHSMSDIPY